MERTRWPGIYKGRRGYDAVASFTENGRRQQKWRRGFASVKAAREWQATTLQALREGQVVSVSRLTLSDLWRGKWLPYKATHLRPASLDSLHWAWGHIEPALGNRRLASLTTLDIESFLTSLYHKGLSSNSRRVLLAHLSTVLNDAVKWNLIPRSPCRYVKAPEAERRTPPDLSAEDILRLIEAARECGIGTLVSLAVATGMRRGELLALRWADIDFASGELVVRQAKTRAGERRVLLPEPTVAELQSHRALQLREAGPDAAAPEVVFLSRGRQITLRELRQLWIDTCARAGFPGLHLHDLRHLHATLLMRAGVHLSVVQHRLGHADIGITAGTYTHVTTADQVAAVEAVSKLLATSRN